MEWRVEPSDAVDEYREEVRVWLRERADQRARENDREGAMALEWAARDLP